MRATCRRLDEGRPIKQAMRDGKLNLMRLAQLTRELDPDGNGVSYQLIGFLITGGKSGRNTVSPKSAGLIAQALECPQEKLFEPSCTSMRRAGDGQPIRDAIAALGTDLDGLGARTAELDPAGRGVARKVLERLADPGEQGAHVISQRCARLVASALGTQENSLFAPADSVMPASSA